MNTCSWPTELAKPFIVGELGPATDDDAVEAAAAAAAAACRCSRNAGAGCILV